MKEGFERLGGFIFSKKISSQEKDSLIAKSKSEEPITTNSDLSIKEAIDEVEEKHEDLLGKKIKIMPEKVTALAEKLYQELEDRMQQYADRYLELDGDVAQKVSDSETNIETVESLKANTQNLSKDLESVLTYFNEDGRIEQTPQFHQHLQKLQLLQKQVEVISKETVDENYLIMEEKLARVCKEASVELNQVINPTDSSLN